MPRSGEEVVREEENLVSKGSLFQCCGRCIDKNLIYPNSRKIMRTWTASQEGGAREVRLREKTRK